VKFYVEDAVVKAVVNFQLVCSFVMTRVCEVKHDVLIHSSSHPVRWWKLCKLETVQDELHLSARVLLTAVS